MDSNTATIFGRVVDEPTARTTRAGNRMLSFRVASRTTRFDRDEGRWVTASMLYITVTCWGRLAENVAPVASPGTPVMVVGELRTNEYRSNDGAHHSHTEITANTVGLDLRWTRGVLGARSTRAVHPVVAPGTDTSRTLASVPAGRLYGDADAAAPRSDGEHDDTAEHPDEDDEAAVVRREEVLAGATG